VTSSREPDRDAARQRSEEEAATFDRWQAELDGAAPAAARFPAETDGADGSDGAAAHGSSDANGPDAAAWARRVQVVVLNCAIKARDDRSRHPHPELFGAPCDFFTRAAVSPGQMDPHDGQRHTSGTRRRVRQ
jgi:hypothetical protein